MVLLKKVIMKKIKLIGVIGVFCFVLSSGFAKEYHVAIDGNDQNSGSAMKPFKSISAAAQAAMPGDVITVHEGVYRERINPPRGGEADSKRITYRAAEGEKVVIKGSEVIKGWTKVKNDTWKVRIPKTFFGDFNPYEDLIRGDWFNPKGRSHHTGAVYLNGHWLTEAAEKEDVMAPAGKEPLWFCNGKQAHGTGYLFNISSFTMGDTTIPATAYESQWGIQEEPSSEGGKCIGYINAGDGARYERIHTSQNIDKVKFRVASATKGGVIELRLNNANGELLGSCTVPETGGWQTWQTVEAKMKPHSGIKNLCLVFKGHGQEKTQDDEHTIIWVQFKDVNPNEANVEINVRQSIFYPDKPGRNYITVRGFKMMHAATNWAPPTAEQIGLIGTHWSKGWIIEDNDISYSVCTGLTLGKYGDEYDNTSQNSAEGYVKTIKRGLARGWSKENIGSHIVRNNNISHCEQAGIVGSLGAAFSTVIGNTIHDIHVRRLFGGAEMAGIKFHGAVDTLVSNNHIYRTKLGIWLDWMTQGTRVTGNLLHDNGPGRDLFAEVNHGPFLVDNNIMLSGEGILINSQGGAYVHNLIAGSVHVVVDENRRTPYLKEHSTEIAGLAPNLSGDDRHYNNIFVNSGLEPYDKAVLPVFMGGNVFCNDAKPSKHETGLIIQPDTDPAINLIPKNGSVYLHINLDKTWSEKATRKLVTTKLLGKAKTPDLPYLQPDGSPYQIDTDYFGNKRNVENPFPGPFAKPERDENDLKVW
ncbi:carbohydrate-binding protein [Sedimentisphaera salicampi]|uniref:Endo-1,4-beta-xylanase Z n=1 Tax=Sedimentisphaera salicampi TaxID=1941349 RepID=A0A1W6LKA0_9BACT|nr:carbohydrate-binding protein [Sedimentisphaera salicampi]ARN56185.1 Endo-1,4-beta-xylanase Z precursor [Sedimentisphaera salicampi]